MSLQKQEAEMKKQQLAASKTSIGFNYDDDAVETPVKGTTDSDSDEGSACFSNLDLNGRNLLLRHVRS